MPLDRRSFLAGLAAATAAVGVGCATSGGTESGATAGTPGPSEPGPRESPSSGAPPATTGGGPARFVDRGPAGATAVALTFHTNGDLGLAQKLLDITRDHGARITNFVVGDWLDANPTWARKLLDAGHELANHTYTHPEFTALDRAGMTREITRCHDVIARLTGTGGTYFRPSGTDDGTASPSAAVLEVAGAAGYPTVLGWDVEPYDYQDPGADAVRTRVLDGVRGGSIVSLHFGHPGTITALPAILDGLAAKKLRPVPVHELLG